MNDRTATGGAGETRLPPVGPRSDRIALATARIPFGVKLAGVWALIFLVVGAFFAASRFDTAWMSEKFAYVFGGLRYTITIALAGIVLAIVMALIGALGRLSRNPVAFGLSGFYASFFRGTPLIVQMFLIYLALPQVGVNLEQQFPGLPGTLSDVLTLDAAVAGVLALGLNYGAYMTEIFRAGIQAVGHGQAEAAEALGMTYRQKMRRVVLPQALRIIIPPTGNEFIAMMKDSALVSFLGATATTAELFRRAQLMGKKDFKSLEALVLAAGLYWALTAIFTYFQGRLERRLSKGHVRAVAGIPH
ncbi:MAG: amino acid ABC transporter permease [Actinomycetota bacterium]